jgi:hypothetical protein
MLADQRDYWLTHWNRNGGPFDILAIAVALIVIVGGLFIFRTASQEYRVSGLPQATVANNVPVLTPAVPAPDTKPKQ